MKTLFIVLLFSIFLLTSCVTHIPAEDIYFRVYTPRGLEVMKMEKGYLDEINKGKAWVTVKEYDEKMKGLK